MRVALKTLDDHDIDRAQLLKHLDQRRFVLAAKFVDDGPAPARDDGDFAGAGRPVQPGILPVIGIEVMMRVLAVAI